MFIIHNKHTQLLFTPQTVSHTWLECDPTRLRMRSFSQYIPVGGDKIFCDPLYFFFFLFLFDKCKTYLSYIKSWWKVGFLKKRLIYMYERDDVI